MKGSEPAMNLTPAEEAERFHASFTSQQENLEKKIASSESVSQDYQKEHFAELNASLQCLQKYYSASSPYLRIYYRKRYQDALQELQVKLLEAETKGLPRKKFVFKSNKPKGKPVPVKNGNGAAKVVGIKYEVAVKDDSCLISNKVDEVIVITSETATGKAILLSKLRGCTVKVLAAPSTVHMADIQDCTISIGPVTTSVFVEEANKCKFELACQQLRIHQSIDTDFYVHVTSKAIIEDCHQVRFGIYSFSYPTLDDDYVISGLNREVNNWREIDDFNWLVAGQASPNWSLMENCSPCS